jgi:hypothetical protein
MKNELRIIASGPASCTAFFSGKTGSGEYVKDEEAHIINARSTRDAAKKALMIFGVDLENTNIILD